METVYLTYGQFLDNISNIEMGKKIKIHEEDQ